MPLLDTIRRLDSGLTRSFAVTLILTIASFILGQLYDKKPNLRYQIISQSPVYDLRENVTTLDIIFDGKSIRQQQQTLSLITLKVENAGNAGISKQVSFDESSLPGFKVADAKIVKADIISSGSDYISGNFQLTQKTENEFTFGPCIIDEADFVIIKILALHGESLVPKLSSFGKIAGSARIDVIDEPSDVGNDGFLLATYSGGLAIQGLRLVSYALLFLVILIAAITAFIWFRDKFSTWKRRKHVAVYKRTLASKPKPQQEAIIELYLKSDVEAVVSLNELFSNSDLLTSEIELWNKHSSSSSAVHPEDPEWMRPTKASRAVMLLVDKAANVNADGTATVDIDWLTAAREFESFLMHHVPEKIRRARQQTQPEPYGTESHTMSALSDREPSVQPQTNA